MNKLRPISSALAAIMIASVLAGCGGDSMKAVSAGAGSVSQTTTTDPAAEAAAQAATAKKVAAKALAARVAKAKKTAAAEAAAAKTAAATVAAAKVAAEKKAAAAKAPVRRDANGFALDGPPQATSPANYDNPSQSDCLQFRDQLRAWSNYQNQHRPAGSTNQLPSSGEVQYLYIVCHLDY